MKINRLETHDRLIEFHKQADYISQGCQDCINNRPEEFGNLPFYIFAHARTHENGSDKRLIWTPRLTRPEAQTNSMLFKVYPPDIIKIIWMIPDKAMWKQYKKGNVTEHNIVMESIDDYKNRRRKLEAPDPDDLEEEYVNQIYNTIKTNANRKNLMDRLYLG
jgi:hypothetical protein